MPVITDQNRLVRKSAKESSGRSLFLSTLALAVGAFLAGCAQQDEQRFSDRAEVEGRASAKADRAAEDARAIEMELDLARRHRFYQSVSGIFAGRFLNGDGTEFETKIRIVPSLPPYIPTGRVRTPDEIAADLNGLFLHVQVMHWPVGTSGSALPCVFSEVRGNLEAGKVDLIGTECLNVYGLYLADDESIQSRDHEAWLRKSRDLAQKVLDGSSPKSTHLRVLMQPSNDDRETIFLLERRD